MVVRLQDDWKAAGSAGALRGLALDFKGYAPDTLDRHGERLGNVCHVAGEPRELVDEADLSAGLGCDEPTALGKVGILGLKHVQSRKNQRQVSG